MANLDSETLNLLDDYIDNAEKEIMLGDYHGEAESFLNGTVLGASGNYLEKLSYYYENSGKSGPNGIIWDQPANQSSSNVGKIGKGFGLFGFAIGAANAAEKIYNNEEGWLNEVGKQSLSLGVGTLIGGVVGGAILGAAATASAPVIIGAAAVSALVGGIAGNSTNYLWDNLISHVEDSKQQGLDKEQAIEKAINDLLGDAEDYFDNPKDTPFGPSSPFCEPPMQEKPGLPPYMQDGVVPQTETPRDEASPLILDLGASGIELTSVNSAGSVYWDLDQDGMAEATGWVGAEDGLLAIDRNGDGIVTDHSELFGTESDNGFVILAEFDNNGDGTINVDDAAFAELLVWVDANTDGYSQDGELYSLSDLGIASIDLGFTEADYDLAGNNVRAESVFTMTDGTSKQIVDAWFTYDNVNSTYAQDVTLDARTLFLPTLRGYGQMADLHIAMSLDDDLLLQVQEVAQADLSTLFDPEFNLEGKIKDILYRWANVETVNPDGRGSYIDGRDLAFLEALTDRPFEQRGSENPAREAAQTLKNGFNDAYNALSARLLMQSAGTNFFTEVAQYNPVTDTFEGEFVYDLGQIQTMVGNLNLSGEELTQAWNGIIRLIDSTKGLDNLSISERDNLEQTITDSDPDTSLTLQNVLDTIYEPRGLSLNGTNGDDTLIGGAGNDSLFPGNGNDIIYGRAGDDRLQGGRDHDELYGEGGHDRLEGDSGNDYLAGGVGDDTLFGGIGNDTYYYESGVDTIRESSGYDTIEFADTISSEQISINFSDTNKNDIYIYIDGNLALRIENYFTTEGGAVELLKFSDGSEIELSSLTGLSEGTSSDDNLIGNDNEAFPHDTLRGLDGNDTLNGGLGNDVLNGGDDNDTYIVTEGADIIIDSRGEDKIVFGAGLNSTDVSYETDNGGNMHISFDGIRYATIQNQFDHYGYDTIETLEFADGVTIETSSLHFDQIGTHSNDRINGYRYGADINNTIYAGAGNDRVYAYDGDDTIYGEEGDDDIYASYGNDVLDGGAGDDILDGSRGDDTYIVTSGSDTISESSGNDKIIFGSAYNLADMTFGRSGYYGRDLDIKFGDHLAATISNHLFSSDSVEVLEFSDGNTLNLINTPFTLNGTDVSDKLYGHNVKASLNGFDGDDYLFGGKGNDLLNGGKGSDTLEGGVGIDTAVFEKDISQYEINITYTDISVIDLTNGDSDRVNEIEYLQFSDQTIDVENLAGYETYQTYKNILTLTGSANNDEIYGQDRDEVIYGYDGNDKIYGWGGSDVIVGGSGDDYLASDGYSGKLRQYNNEDIIDGGSGNDYMNAGYGNDTYIYTSGNDSIRDEGGTNTLVLPENINLSDLEFSRNISDLDTLNIKAGTLGKISILEQYDYLPNDVDDEGHSLRVEQLRLKDGTEHNIIDFVPIIHGDENNNEMEYYDPHDVAKTIYGYGGDDILYGGDHQDHIAGGTGNDYLAGNNGSDFYYYEAGNDQIKEYGANETNTLVLPENITLSDLTFTRNFDADGSNTYNIIVEDLGLISIVDQYELINFDGEDDSDNLRLENIRFFDGTEYQLGSENIVSYGSEMDDRISRTYDYSFNQYNQTHIMFGFEGNDQLNGAKQSDELYGGIGDDTLFGVKGDDYLHGNAGNDSLVGGQGNDSLVGGLGSDTYFGDEGNDTIIFDKNFSNYSISNYHNLYYAIYVDDLANGDRDTIFEVELYEFTNGTYDVASKEFTPEGLENTAPVAADDNFGGDEGDVITGNVLDDNGNGTDNDGDGDAISVIAGTYTTAQGGSVDLYSGGDFSYTPAAGFYGPDSFEYTLEDGQGGSDTAIVTLDVNEVTGPVDPEAISFNAGTFSAYSSGQDDGQVSVNSQGNEVILSDNAWKKTDFDYTITDNTVIEFDYKSTVQGELQGFSLETDNDYHSGAHAVQLYGTDDHDKFDRRVDYNGSGNWQSFTISAADIVSAGTNIDYLAFINDHDNGAQDATSMYRNFKVYEQEDTPDDPGNDDSITPLINGISEAESADGASMLNGLEAVSVALWVTADQIGTDQPIFDTMSPDSHDNGLSMRYDKSGWAGGGSNVIKLGLRSSEGTYNLESASDVQSDQAQQLVMTWQNGEAIKLYIDGVETVPTSGGEPVSGQLQGIEDFFIGQGFTPGGNWNGTIDGFQVFDTALSSEQIASLSNDSQSVNTAPIAQDDMFSGDQDDDINGNVLADNGNGADTDNDGDTLSVIAGTYDTAQGGSVVLASDGSFSYTPAAGFYGSDSFEYTLEDGQGGSDTGTVELAVEQIVTIPEGKTGLTASYYIITSNVEQLSDIDFDATPLHEETVDKVDHTSSASFYENGPTDNFAAQYQGYLNVQEAGDYTLSLNSDDGSALLLNGDKVIANDGLHGQKTENATLYLESGTHEIELSYFEKGGGQVVQLFWSGPDTNEQKVIIEGNAFTTTEDLSSVNTVPVAENDTFMGDQDDDITGNVLEDNGNGSDTDSDGDNLSVVAGTYSTAEGGSVDLAGDGSFSYTPAEGFYGSDSFDYTLEDGKGGSDTGHISFDVEQGASSHDYLSISPDLISSYGDQDVSGTYEISSDQLQIDLSGNTWKKFDLGSYTITDQTKLSFDFMIPDGGAGEIHGIYLDNNESLDDGDVRAWLDGSQTGNNWVSQGDYTEGDGWVHYDLNMGDLWTGTASSLVFVNDDDAHATAESSFRHIRLYEQSTDDNTAPIAQDDIFSGDQDDDISGNVLADNGNGADSDDDGDALSVMAGTFATVQGGSVDLAGDGSFSYTPADGFYGADSFDYTLEDGQGGSDTGHVSFDVEQDTSHTDPIPLIDGLSSANKADASSVLNGLEAVSVALWVTADQIGTDQPIFDTVSPDNQDGNLSMRYDKSGWAGGGTNVIKLGLQTSEGHYNLESASHVQSNEPQQLVMTWQSGDSIKLYIDGVETVPTHGGEPVGGQLQDIEDFFIGEGFTPGGTWNGTIDGFQVFDTALSSEQILSLSNDNRSVNTAPIAQDDIFSGDQDDDISGNVLDDNGNGADSDDDGDALSVMAGTFATVQGGSVDLAGDGSFTYTPVDGFYGADSFDYTLEDGQSGSDIATVELSITEDKTDTGFNMITITRTANNDYLDLSSLIFTSYRNGQDDAPDGLTLTQHAVTLQGNIWKKAAIDYTVTDNSVLEFDYTANSQGEVAGIGIDIDNDLNRNPREFVQLGGSQVWDGVTQKSYDTLGETQSYRINLSDLAEGDVNYLTFIGDADHSAEVDQTFSNIRIYEDSDPLIDSSYAATGEADMFTFDELPLSGRSYEITGFDTNEDSLDLSGLLEGYDPVSDAIANFVQITDDGQDSTITIDQDGNGDDFVDIAKLINATGLNDEELAVSNEQMIV